MKINYYKLNHECRLLKLCVTEASGQPGLNPLRPLKRIKIKLIPTTERSQTYRKIQHVIAYSRTKYEILHMRIASIVIFDHRLKQLLKVVKTLIVVSLF